MRSFGLGYGLGLGTLRQGNGVQPPIGYAFVYQTDGSQLNQTITITRDGVTYAMTRRMLT